MRIEHITEKRLLTGYLSSAYRGREVLVVNMGEFIDAAGSKDSAACFRLLDELSDMLGGELPKAFQMVGYLIIEIDEIPGKRLLRRFLKAPFHMELYFGGEFVDDNYTEKDERYEIQKKPWLLRNSSFLTPAGTPRSSRLPEAPVWLFSLLPWTNIPAGRCTGSSSLHMPIGRRLRRYAES